MNGVAILIVPAQRGELPCQVDSRFFFAEQERDVDQAKALCADCPIQLACLAGAIERREPWGVWGGEVFVEGAIVAHKRGRGRPRKHPLGTGIASARPSPVPQHVREAHVAA